MKWVMEGNKGLVYLRIMRAASAVLYEPDFEFVYGNGYWLFGDFDSEAFLVSSGRQVHESLAAAKVLEKEGLPIAVIDMPSIDRDLLNGLYDSDKPVFLAEQNNGYIWAECRRELFARSGQLEISRIIPINTLDENGSAQFIHSATYEQLIERFGLSPAQLRETVKDRLKAGG
jgi:transketolase C-terminal domain/subunit